MFRDKSAIPETRKSNPKLAATTTTTAAPQGSGSLASTWDIRTQGPGQLNPIKDQQDCSGCWAFATAACIENGYSIKTGTLYSLSEQQQLDCNTDCYGCAGGYIQESFQYTENGLATEANYPYIDGAATCYASNVTKVASNVNFYRLGSDSVTIQEHISTLGACAVCVDGTNWWDYAGGIYNAASATPQCNHAVTIVGYGPGYWLLRNSWGTDFGTDGYIQVATTPDGGMFADLIYCPTF